MKRLLTKDYDKIIIEAFNLPKKDFLKYYSNVIDEYHKNNPDIFEGLTAALNKWLSWHQKQNNFYLGWEIGENNKKTPLDPDQFFSPLPDINRSVNRAFFTLQINIIETLKKKPRESKKETLLFRDPDKEREVISIFETKGYTENGKWKGISENRTELLAAYYVLKDKSIFYPGKITPQAKAFYKIFGLDVPGYISERALTNEPYNKDREEFEKVFANI